MKAIWQLKMTKFYLTEGSLMEVEKLAVWYLHIIDRFTCFSEESIVTTKKPREIVMHFIYCRISVHGPLCRLFSDNGGEFNNKEMRDRAKWLI